MDGVVALSAAQMSYLLEAIDWRNPQPTWRPQSAGLDWLKKVLSSRKKSPQSVIL
jgi:hypothetical protein